ncbi:hypothetical protein pipiens_020086, partial [Culex pipiens pipiens]
RVFSCAPVGQVFFRCEGVPRPPRKS